MPLSLKRRVTFLAKAEYFTGTGVKGVAQRAFFSGAGQVPIDRSSASAAEGAIQTGLRILQRGQAARHLPRGHPLARRPALPRQDRRRADGPGDRRPGHPGRHDLQQPRSCPFGKKMPRVEVRFGKPLDFSRYEGLSGDRFVVRSITDEIMYEIMMLSGQEYVDVYGATVKKSMDSTGASAPEVVAKLQPPPEEAADRAPTTLAG